MNEIELVQWINSLIHYNNIKAFYNCASWAHLRQEVLNEQHNECQLCKPKGLYSEAVTAHHIKYVRRSPELALTKSNIIAVCGECHFNIHHKFKQKEQINVEKW